MTNFIDEYKKEIKLSGDELEETKNKMYLIRDANAETTRDASCNLIYDNAVLTKVCMAVGNIVLDNFEKIDEQEQIIEHKDSQISKLSKYIGKSNPKLLDVVSNSLKPKSNPKSKYMEKFRKTFINEIYKDDETNKKIGYK